MSKLENLIKKIKTIDFDVFFETILQNENVKNIILSLNREQLWDGKTKEGENIRPSYLEDDFFKSQEQAQKYVEWKEIITPNPNRDKNTPNLYINGFFYENIGIRNDSGGVVIFAENSFAQEIENKFKNIFGLNSESWEQIKPYILDKLQIEVRKYLEV